MARAIRTYDHFCMLARALERVGDRWTLLVVRDLLGGPRRFTDLMARLGGITPKTLAQRLRELTEAGIVEVDRTAGRREVWYRLTPAGGELAPVVEALSLWGLRHARRPRLPGEPAHPEHLLQAIRLVLQQGPPPAQPLTWRFDFADDGAYTLGFDGHRWTLASPPDARTPDLTVDTTSEAWLRFLGTAPEERRAPQPGVELQGTASATEQFTRLLARFPDGADEPPPREARADSTGPISRDTSNERP
jgi:DNA-binding HxlR family transcriptional regulator